jgi:hypothetical protein
MIDWFVLLTPLAVLPIVLLFAFVGCAFKTSPIETDDPSTAPIKPRVWLHYGPGFEKGIDSLEVRFEYQPLDDPDTHVLSQETLQEFDPSGGDVDRTNWANLEQFIPCLLYCYCTPLPQGQEVTTSAQKCDGKQELGKFVFSRTNGGFGMTVEP